MSSLKSKSPVAAFFDLDGTLLPLPSLERRFVTALRRRHAIPAGNYFRWLAQSVRLLPHGIHAVTNANKMYLRNIPTQGDAAAVSRFPAFFPAALDRIAWHVGRGHAIVLITGAPAPLASEAALVLLLRLMARGLTARAAICATKLEQAGGRWTGRVTGEAIYGQAKLRAMQKIAAKNSFELSHSYAYGDSTQDKWMLGAVGRPAAINPSRELERIAKLRNWPILRWPENGAQNVSPSATPEYRFSIDRAVSPNNESETLG
jgi:HAD superfamily hydrolase (TIGR01490 family)